MYWLRAGCVRYNREIAMTIESRSEKLRIRKSSVLAFLVAGVRLGGLYAQLYEQQFGADASRIAAKTASS